MMVVLGHGLLLVGRVLIALILPPEALPSLVFCCKRTFGLS